MKPSRQTAVLVHFTNFTTEVSKRIWPKHDWTKLL